MNSDDDDDDILFQPSVGSRKSTRTTSNNNQRNDNNNTKSKHLLLDNLLQASTNHYTSMNKIHTIQQQQQQQQSTTVQANNNDKISSSSSLPMITNVVSPTSTSLLSAVAAAAATTSSPKDPNNSTNSSSKTTTTTTPELIPVSNNSSNSTNTKQQQQQLKIHNKSNNNNNNDEDDEQQLLDTIRQLTMPKNPIINNNNNNNNNNNSSNNSNTDHTTIIEHGTVGTRTNGDGACYTTYSNNNYNNNNDNNQNELLQLFDTYHCNLLQRAYDDETCYNPIPTTIFSTSTIINGPKQYRSNNNNIDDNDRARLLLLQRYIPMTKHTITTTWNSSSMSSIDCENTNINNNNNNTTANIVLSKTTTSSITTPTTPSSSSSLSTKTKVVSNSCSTSSSKKRRATANNNNSTNHETTTTIQQQQQYFTSSKSAMEYYYQYIVEIIHQMMMIVQKETSSNDEPTLLQQQQLLVVLQQLQQFFTQTLIIAIQYSTGTTTTIINCTTTSTVIQQYIHIIQQLFSITTKCQNNITSGSGSSCSSSNEKDSIFVQEQLHLVQDQIYQIHHSFYNWLLSIAYSSDLFILSSSSLSNSGTMSSSNDQNKNHDSSIHHPQQQQQYILLSDTSLYRFSQSNALSFAMSIQQQQHLCIRSNSAISSSSTIPKSMLLLSPNDGISIIDVWYQLTRDWFHYNHDQSHLSSSNNNTSTNYRKNDNNSDHYRYTINIHGFINYLKYNEKNIQQIIVSSGSTMYTHAGSNIINTLLACKVILSSEIHELQTIIQRILFDIIVLLLDSCTISSSSTTIVASVITNRFTTMKSIAKIALQNIPSLICSMKYMNKKHNSSSCGDDDDDDDDHAWLSLPIAINSCIPLNKLSSSSSSSDGTKSIFEQQRWDRRTLLEFKTVLSLCAIEQLVYQSTPIGKSGDDSSTTDNITKSNKNRNDIESLDTIVLQVLLSSSKKLDNSTPDIDEAVPLLSKIPWVKLLSSSSHLCWLALGTAYCTLHQLHQAINQNNTNNSSTVTIQQFDFDDSAKVLATIECVILLYQTGMLLLRYDGNDVNSGNVSNGVDSKTSNPPSTAVDNTETKAIKKSSTISTEFGGWNNLQYFYTYMLYFDDICTTVTKSILSPKAIHPNYRRADILLKYIHIDAMKIKQRLQYIIGKNHHLRPVQHTEPKLDGDEENMNGNSSETSNRDDDFVLKVCSPKKKQQAKILSYFTATASSLSNGIHVHKNGTPTKKASPATVIATPLSSSTKRKRSELGRATLKPTSVSKINGNATPPTSSKRKQMSIGSFYTVSTSNSTTESPKIDVIKS